MSDAQNPPPPVSGPTPEDFWEGSGVPADHAPAPVSGAPPGADFWEGSGEAVPQAAAAATHFTPGQSAMLGAGKMGSFGFGDRIGGAGLGLYRWLQDRQGKGGSLGDQYERARDEGRQAYSQAKEENPGSYYAGGAMGVMGTGAAGLGTRAAMAGAMSVPFAASAAPLGVAGRTAVAAGQGAAYGLGDTPDLSNAKEAAENAGIGAATGGAAHGVLGEAAPWIARGGAKQVRNKLGSIVFGVPEAATERFAARPAQVEGAAPLADKARSFVEDVGEARGENAADSTRGFNILKGTGITTSHDSYTGPLEAAKQEIAATGGYGPGKRSGMSMIDGLINDVHSDAVSQGGQIGLDRGKAMVMTLDNELRGLRKNGGDPIVINALTGARQSIDAQLKSQSPDYASHMDQLAANTRALAPITDSFKGGQNDAAKNQAAMGMMNQVMRGKRPFLDEALQKFDANQGTDYSEGLKDSYAQQAFQGGRPHGSRAVLGGLVGGSTVGGAAHAFGVPPEITGMAGMAGAMAGATLDRYGGPMWMSALKAGAIPAKFAGYLASAAQRGGAAPAVTHEILMKQYPEYRSAIENYMSSQGATP